MKRLCFIAPNLATTHKVVDELGEVGVTDSHIHVVGKHPDWVESAHLHNANVLQTTNLVPALKAGLLFSVILIIALFVVVHTFLPEIELNNVAMMGIIGFGLFSGLWVCAFVGFGIKNKAVELSENEIKIGNYLVMIDVPKEREQEITDRILKLHPEMHLAVDAHKS